MVHQPLIPSLSVGLGASVIAHVGLMVAVSHGPMAARALESADRADSRVEIEMVEPLEAQAAEPSDAPAVRPAVRSSRFQRHHHLYRVPADHDAVPHDARVEHARTAAAAPAEASGAAAADAPIPASAGPPPPVARFELPTIGRPRVLVSTTGALPAGRPGALADGGAAGGRAHGGEGEDGGEDAGGVVAENRVTVRARLQSSALPAYPLAARQNEIEVDVALEIVVDTAGRVTSSRVLGPRGYGLDEAALDAMTHYRFFPAQRDGHPVRVRMRWVVQFRLR